MLLYFIFSFFFVSSVASLACNGNQALCSRRYSNVTQIGAHDSAFVGELPMDNQGVSVKSQLDAGIRFLQAQTHLLNGHLELCHTSCLELNAGSLTHYLTTIKTWMDANPNEVITLLLTNGDRVDVTMFGDAMESTELASYVFLPGMKLSIAQWPTLGELITAGTRLVMFLGTFTTLLVFSQINFF